MSLVIWLQPAFYLSEQLLIILHMLKHFDGQNPIKSPVVLKIEKVHIPGQDLQVLEPMRVDVFLLRLRVGKCCDSRVGILLCQKERE